MQGHSKGVPNPDPGKPVTLYAPNAIHSPCSFISTGSNYISAAVTISPTNDGMSMSPPSVVSFANGSTQHLLVRRHPKDSPVCIPTSISPNNTKSYSYHHPATAYRKPKVHLLDLQRHSIWHHPDTAQGHAAYHAVNRNNKADEFRPYPLTLGTKALSSGACFNCGRNSPAKHTLFQCPHGRDALRSLPPLEQSWRAIAAIVHSII